MEVGDLVMVRLKAGKDRRTLAPGLIIGSLQKDRPPTFEILVNGARHILTHRDIGPFGLFDREKDQ